MDACRTCSQILFKKADLCFYCRSHFVNADVITSNLNYFNAHSLFFYEDVLADVIQALKGGRWGSTLVSEMTEILIQKLKVDVSELRAVIPAPAKVFGEKDHAWLIASHISRILGIPLWDGFLTRASSASQKSRSGLQRRLVDINPCDYEKFQKQYDGGRLVFVDDVLTTGSTLLKSWHGLGCIPAIGLTLAFTPRNP